MFANLCCECTHTCQRVPIVFVCMCAFVYEYERCVFACGYWSLCVCSVCICLCVREGLFVLVSAVSGWVPPRSCLPHQGLAWAEAEAMVLAGE